MKLLITPLAAFDLEEIGDYIANPMRAVTFSCVHIAKRFVSTLRAIGAGPTCRMTCAHARMATM